MHYVDQPESLDRNGIAAAILAERQSQRRKWPVHYDSVEPFAIAADIATITISSVLSGFLYHLQDAAGANDVSKSLGLAILVSALFVSLMKVRGMYRPAELLIVPHQIRAACLTWVTAFLVLAGALFALKIGSEFSRGSSIVFAMFGLMALVLHRKITAYLLAKGARGEAVLRPEHRSDHGRREQGQSRPGPGAH
jgi:putative colanic acid biosynthesis UDP-glucose lipid carrier transferase